MDQEEGQRKSTDEDNISPAGLEVDLLLDALHCDQLCHIYLQRTRNWSHLSPCSLHQASSAFLQSNPSFFEWTCVEIFQVWTSFFRPTLFNHL